MKSRNWIFCPEEFLILTFEMKLRETERETESVRKNFKVSYSIYSYCADRNAKNEAILSVVLFWKVLQSDGCDSIRFGV